MPKAVRAKVLTNNARNNASATMWATTVIPNSFNREEREKRLSDTFQKSENHQLQHLPQINGACILQQTSRGVSFVEHQHIQHHVIDTIS